MQPLLSIKDLSIIFCHEGKQVTAVNKISFNVSPGEIVAIVGESGSGKSVSALSLLNLLPANSSVTGEILFYKKEIGPINLLKLDEAGINKIRGKEISMIFQEPMTSLNPVFTCGNQVLEAIRLHQKLSRKAALRKTIELFELVQLPDPETIMRRYPHQLSGGQKQRVMIAMAMSGNPSLLIADEPTTALDVTVQMAILQLIKKIQKQNNTGVIFITHDLGVVADIADKVIVMLNGEIVEKGNVKELFCLPQHPYTKALLACRPANQPKGKRLQVVNDVFIPPKIKDPGYPTTEELNIQPEIGEDRPVLSVKGLTVSFPVKQNLFGRASQFYTAVENLSFIVKKGETLGLVGESGSGKTTLGRAILQLIPYRSGEILLEGKDISKMNPAALRNLRKDLQVIFQDPYGSLNPRMTIGKAILEPLKTHALFNNKESREKVMEILEKVSISPDQFNRYPHQFSGGQRQRICIARALILNPSFLIFDESVSALDVSVQAQVLNLLNDLKHEFNFTAIFISHDLSVVHYIADRIMVMYRGKIVEEGEAGEIYHHPKNEYTQKLISAIPGRNLIHSY